MISPSTVFRFALILAKFFAHISPKTIFVPNMGHNQLKKCSKYHFVSLLHEKYRSTFDNFVQPFNQSAILTNCGLATQALSRSDTTHSPVFMLIKSQCSQLLDLKLTQAFSPSAEEQDQGTCLRFFLITYIDIKARSEIDVALTFMMYFGGCILNTLISLP